MITNLIMQYKYNNKTLEDYKQQTLKELINIKNNLTIEFCSFSKNINFESDEFYTSSQEQYIALEEIDIYINFTKNIEITLVDTVEVTLSKLYLLFHTMSDTKKFFNEHIAVFYNMKNIDNTHLLTLLGFNNPFLMYNSSKAILFAREMYLRKKHDKKYKTNWKSTNYVLINLIDQKRLSKKNKKKVKK